MERFRQSGYKVSSYGCWTLCLLGHLTTFHGRRKRRWATRPGKIWREQMEKGGEKWREEKGDRDEVEEGETGYWGRRYGWRTEKTRTRPWTRKSKKNKRSGGGGRRQAAAVYQPPTPVLSQATSWGMGRSRKAPLPATHNTNLSAGYSSVEIFGLVTLLCRSFPRFLPFFAVGSSILLQLWFSFTAHEPLAYSSRLSSLPFPSLRLPFLGVFLWSRFPTCFIFPWIGFHLSPFILYSSHIFL